MVVKTDHLIRVASLAELKATNCLTVLAERHTIVLFAYGDKVYAVDNRCPHMGFPLDKGSVKDGILTCHWHHARFDLASGGTFDQFADDVRDFPVEVRDGEIWVDLAQRHDPREHQQDRLQVGLERDISLVIAKAVILLMDNGGDSVEPFRIGLEFGSRYRDTGWGQGLTMHTCFMNMLPALDADDRPRAMFHGLSAVARDTGGHPPRFGVRPLPTQDADIPTLKRWLRQFIEVRDSEGAERCVISALRAGATPEQMADMLFASVTDHRYIQVGHPADFTNKAFEALDLAGWEYAEGVLASLVMNYANASRMEESNEWRNPIDLIAILDNVFVELPAVLEHGSRRRGAWAGRDAMIPTLLSDDPQAIADALLNALRDGCSMEQLASTVTYAAALRIAQFHTSNEFGDWDTALHTFTFANAIHQGLRRSPSPELLRGVFDAAMSVYLDRFLNIPAARIPQPNGAVKDPAALLTELPALLNQQQQVNEAGRLVAQYLYNGGDADRLLAALGSALLREDRDFHTIQSVEAAFRQYDMLRGTEAGIHALIGAARYLAAHSPTVRAQGQTYQIARRLHRGELLFEE
jgi:nitrite reductase/ring-hydroxylating ferredoxin subunit